MKEDLKGSPFHLSSGCGCWPIEFLGHPVDPCHAILLICAHLRHLRSKKSAVSSAASKNELVIDAFGLDVIERRQRGQGGGFGLVQNPSRHRLQGGPTGPIDGW